jgi:lipopolysaccharide/colanic/teichoic acid biosynthesis glycosyltransferase
MAQQQTENALNGKPEFGGIMSDTRMQKYEKRRAQLGRMTDDQLKQKFLNVLQGNMSLVGPRAYRDEELKEYAIKYPQTQKYIKHGTNPYNPKQIQKQTKESTPSRNIKNRLQITPIPKTL